MPKVKHILPTVGADISLTYPSTTGTIALTSDITTAVSAVTTTLPPQTFISHGSNSCTCSGGFWETVAHVNLGSNMANNAYWRIQMAARCNKFTGSAFGQNWLLRWYNVGASLPYTEFTVPLGSGTYDWLVFDQDIINTTGTTTQIILQSSKSVGGGVSQTAQFKSITTKYY